MSWDDFNDGLNWENHIFKDFKRQVWNGRDTVWVGIHQNYKVREMEDQHIKNCMRIEGLHPRWYELFKEELRIRLAEDFEDDN